MKKTTLLLTILSIYCSKPEVHIDHPAYQELRTKCVELKNCIKSKKGGHVTSCPKYTHWVVPGNLGGGGYAPYLKNNRLQSCK